MVLAMNTGNSSALSQQHQPPPVTTLLHDEQVPNPSTTNLRGLHAAQGIQQHLFSLGPVGEGDITPSPFSSYRPDSTCEENPQPHRGRMYKPTRLWVTFTGNFITVL